MMRLVWITAIVLATLVGLVVMWQLRAVILVFFLSLWTAAAIRPAIDSLERQGLKRSLALFPPYLVGIAILLLLGLVFAIPFVDDVQRIGDDAVIGYEEVAERWQEGTAWQRALAIRLPDPQRLYDDVFARRGADTLWGVMGFTFGLFWVALNVLLIIVLSLYWSIDRVHFERLWLSLLPVGHRTAARRVWRDIEREAGHYLRSQIVLCVAAGLLLAIGYKLLGYPYPALLALVAALLWLVPWLGTLLATAAALLLAAPVMAIDGGTGTLFAASAAALLTLCVLLSIEIWVEPRLFERRRYNSLMVVLIVIGMAQVFGFLGFVLAPLIASALQIIGGHLFRMRLGDQSQRGGEPINLQDRLELIRNQLAEHPEPPPGLLSLSKRLESLLEEVRDLPRLSPDGEPIVVYPGDSAASTVAAATEQHGD